MPNETPPTTSPQSQINTCAQCNYDISNQPISFITEYHLLAVRCPECGQQQPSGLTVQPKRFRKLKYAFMLSVWTVLVFVAFFSIPIALTSMAQSTAYAALEPFDNVISVAQAQSDPIYHTTRWDTVFNPQYEINTQWWMDHGEAYANSAFDPSKHIDLFVLTDWLWFILIAPPIAFLFYALFNGASRLIVYPVMTFSFLLAAFMTYLATSVNFALFYLNPRDCSMLTASHIIAWPTFIIGSLAICISYILAPRIFNMLAKRIPSMPINREPNI